MCELCNDKNRIFEEKARKVHGDKYIYTLVNYINNSTDVDIICRIHGVFKQRPQNHLNGAGCPYCFGNKKLTNETFKEKAYKIHGDDYDYSEINYVNATTKIGIICHKKDENGIEHGVFWQTPNAHLNGQGCPICGRHKIFIHVKRSFEEILNEFYEIHGQRYDYSKFIYNGINTKSIVICPEHGEFEITPYRHINGGGCPICASLKRSNDTILKRRETILNDIISKHGNDYDYSEFDYQGAHIKSCIICHKKDKNGVEHGRFWQTPSSHLSGKGCPKCAVEKTTSYTRNTLEKFVEKSIIKHKGKYTYEDFEYINCDTPSYITCPIHGKFKQTLYNHLNLGCGCPKCNASRLELEVMDILDRNNIEYIYQVTKRQLPWIGNQRPDFYLMKYRIVIECQGEQHYRPVDFSGNGMNWAKKNFLKIQTDDAKKLKKCTDNDTPILYIKYDNNDIENFLLNELKQYEKRIN